MNRVTTNKPVDEMSMLELAYNSCYAKDGKAMYRDFSFNTDARDLARHIMKLQAKIELPEDDEKFDGVMLDCLQYDPATSIVGTVALFYRNLWAMADMRERLKAYEDKEEQGLLPILMQNDTVWDIDWGKPKSWRITAFSFGSAGDYIDEPVSANEMVYYYENYGGSITGSFASSEIGKSIFLTEAEAEEALARMKEE